MTGLPVTVRLAAAAASAEAIEPLRTLFQFGADDADTRYQVTLVDDALPVIPGGEATVVCQAVDLTWRKPVAVKFLVANPAVDRKQYRIYKDLLKNEHQVTRGLKHPGIVKIFSYDIDNRLGPPLLQKTADGRLVLRFRPPSSVAAAAGEYYTGVPFLVMEWVDGDTLRNFMSSMRRENRRPSVYLSLQILIQILQAIDQAHKKGVVHGDIKPSNVLVTDDPQCPGGKRVTLIDFATAQNYITSPRRWVMKDTSPDVPVPGYDLLVAGTSGFMAPEQETGLITPASDLFAIGALAYSLLGWQRLPPNPAVGLPPMNLSSELPEIARTILENDVRAMMSPNYETRPTAKRILDKWQRVLKNFVEPDAPKVAIEKGDESDGARSDMIARAVKKLLQSRLGRRIPPWLRNRLQKLRWPSFKRKPRAKI